MDLLWFPRAERAAGSKSSQYCAGTGHTSQQVSKGDWFPGRPWQVAIWAAGEQGADR